MAWSPTRVSPEACSVLARHPTGLSPSPLPGGTANRGLVVRVGNTVRRPIAPCWPATHALLAHLRTVGFQGAPQVLAANAATEVLTYIDGRAAVPPLPEMVPAFVTVPPALKTMPTPALPVPAMVPELTTVPGPPTP